MIASGTGENGASTASRLDTTDPSNSNNLNGDGNVCVRVCARACVRACVLDVFAIYDNIFQPRLIMIIIKIISYQFIHTHTDDFLSTGTRLVLYKVKKVT